MEDTAVIEDKSRKSKLSKDSADPNVYFGKQIFKFSNGDLYAGQFKATIKKDIYRHGNGKYFCADSTTYSGVWHEDQLVEAKCISLQDGDYYEGPLQNSKFSGAGVYKMSQIGDINTTFVDNCPLGNISLIDKRGFHWQGFATNDKNETILYPKNHFKINMTNTTDKEKQNLEENSIVANEGETAELRKSNHKQKKGSKSKSNGG